MSARRSVIALVAGVLSLLLAAAAHAGPSCAPFNDPGCLFGEDWSSYAVGATPGGGWTFHGTPLPAVTLAADGSRQLTFRPAGKDASIGGDVSILPVASIPQGGTYYFEWYLGYNPGFWGDCANPPAVPACNTSQKMIDLLGPEQYMRVLITIDGDDADLPAYSRGHPAMHMYPNYGAGGTDNPSIVGGNAKTEKGPNVVPGFAMKSGPVPYHYVLEVTSAKGLTGAYRLFVDGVLISSWTELQTAMAAPQRLTNIGVGGPYADAGPGVVWSLGKIRLTRTNIAPR